MVIRHIMSKFRIVDIKLIVFVSNKSPMEGIFSSIALECIEFVRKLNIDIFVLALGLTALGLNDPDGAILLHNDIISIEQPLILKSVHVHTGGLHRKTWLLSLEQSTRKIL